MRKIILLQYLVVFVIGMVIGFLGGLFGKGGSGLATPLLSLIGIPGFVAVAAPLPATVPGTLIAAIQYWKHGFLDRPVILWSIAAGVPAVAAGSFLTKYTGDALLLAVTGAMVFIFGLRFLFSPEEGPAQTGADESSPPSRPRYWRLRVAAVAVFIGLASGLLANSGGFLLAPAFARILRLPIKKAFACSLAVSVVLAVPGTVIHAWLGHIDWAVTAVLALGAVPFSYLGAKLAIKSQPRRLERWYGLALSALGVLFLFNI